MAYQIFLSSCFDFEMQKNREIFRADLIARFNEFSGQYGENTFITDFEYGIPDGLKAEQIIDICVSSVKKADLFICILGKRYGYCIEKDRIPAVLLGFRDLLMPESVEDNLISFCEIEILTALLFIPERTSFLVWNISEREERSVRLLTTLFAHNYDIHVFESRESLVDLAVNRFVYYSGYAYNSEITDFRTSLVCEGHGFNSNSITKNLSVSQMQYLSRKLRYSIPQEAVIAKISAYVDSFLMDTFVLSGDTDSGKSMALAEWVIQNMERDDISIHCWFHEEGSNILSVVLMDLLADEQKSVDFFYQDDAVHTFYNVALKKNTTKQVFLLDGLDYLEEAYDVGWLITKMDPSVKIIISLNRNYDEYLPDNNIILENISSLPVQDLIKHIYEREGKGLEYPFIQGILKDICSDWSLRQAAEGIQQFLRIMKYHPGSSQTDWDSTEIREYLGKFNSMYGVFANTKIYLEDNFDTDTVCQSISLLALTERGLARHELSDLMEGKIDIFYQLYFILVQNEDLFMLPESIVEQQIINISKEEILKHRTRLIRYFESVGTERAVIELCWQLVMLPDREGLVDVLSSIKNWNLIHTNSSLYFAGIDRVLSKEQWDQVAYNWKNQLAANPNQYSEKEIYTISDGFNALNRIEDAVDAIQILIDRGGDAFSMASYHQQIASLYEDWGNDCAIDHIEQAIRFLEMTEEQAFVQNKIDTYMAGAYIYAFFLDKQDSFVEQKRSIMDTLNKWLLNAVSLTKQVSYANSNYLILFYHNVAYVYWNIAQYKQALEYIDCALSVSCPDKSLIVSDLQLRAQIYNDIYCEQNKYLSEETGMLTVGENSDNEYLILAEKDLIKALELQQQLLYKEGSFSYVNGLAGLHYVMSQNLGYRGYYEKAIEEIDMALELENQADIKQDLYATYYQAAIVRFGAYNKWKKKSFLIGSLECLNKAEKEIMCNETTDAYYYLEDVQKLRECILKELRKMK